MYTIYYSLPAPASSLRNCILTGSMMPQQDACKHFFNGSKNTWRLHTFLHHFGNTRSFAPSTDADERLSQILITETSCPVKGHPRKARSLVRKWITHTKKNQHALNPMLEQSLLLCLVGKKEGEVKERAHPYPKKKNVSLKYYLLTSQRFNYSQLPIQQNALKAISGTDGCGV